MTRKDFSFFRLNRPEYLPTAELALSELVWSGLPSGKVAGFKRDHPNGFFFGSRSTKEDSSAFPIKPENGTERYNLFLKNLQARLGLSDMDEKAIVAEALLHELEVFGSQKTNRSVAAPMTVKLALMQDAKGVTNKKNPPNIAGIMEQFNSLGGGTEAVAALLLHAYRSANGAGLPEWVDFAANALLPLASQDVAGVLEATNPDVAERDLRVPAWIAQANGTPFDWYARTWQRLCCDGWIDVMPRRRWTDWASCVTRTATGCAYLFEMHLTCRMLAGLLSPAAPEDTVGEMLESSKRLLSWDSAFSKSGQDVGEVLKRLSNEGSIAQDIFSQIHEKIDSFPAPLEYDSHTDGLVRWLADARRALDPHKSKLSPEIARWLDSPVPAKAKNIRETIRYSLLDRGAGQSLDLYSVLKPAGRYTCVDPGQEWLVTVASLCSRGPSKPTRLANLNASLSSLGISAKTATLVQRLEVFGLTRSSHDADDAIEIQPAF